MTRPGLIVSLKPVAPPEERDGSPSFLRDTVLQSQTTLRIAGWSKGNLLRSIEHRSSQTFSMFVFDTHRTANDELLLHLGTRETLSLLDVLNADSARHSPLSIFILYSNEHDFNEVQRLIEGYPAPNTIFLISTGDRHYFYFAFACELTHWWNLQSCLSETVTYDQIGRCIKNVAEAYPKTLAANGCKILICSEQQIGHATAWKNGSNYAPAVDIEKIRHGARGEQLDDTFKRMSDAANYPRQQHSSSEDRMISSQGLFWLAEASPPDQMAMWLRDTRLYRECHPYASENTATISIRELEKPDVRFIQELASHFVHVPSGMYPFGSADESLESEPPARVVNLYLRAFRIMRRPLTYGFLRAFMQCDLPAEMDELPVTNVSFFDAEYIAQVCTSLLRRFGLARERNCVVLLPTEYQWEAAARGKEGKNYPWGAFFHEGCANYGMRIAHPTPPGMYSPEGDSEFGCQDMAGNVREWTRSYGGTRGVDWTAHEEQRVHGDRRQLVESGRLVIKGGSYSYSSECLQSWVRNTQIASRKDCQTGFRLVLEEWNG